MDKNIHKNVPTGGFWWILICCSMECHEYLFEYLFLSVYYTLVTFQRQKYWTFWQSIILSKWPHLIQKLCLIWKKNPRIHLLCFHKQILLRVEFCCEIVLWDTFFSLSWRNNRTININAWQGSCTENLVEL